MYVSMSKDIVLNTITVLKLTIEIIWFCLENIFLKNKDTNFTERKKGGNYAVI